MDTLTTSSGGVEQDSSESPTTKHGPRLGNVQLPSQPCSRLQVAATNPEQYGLEEVYSCSR